MSYSKNIENELHSVYHDERRDEGLSPAQLTSERNSTVGGDLIDIKESHIKYTSNNLSPRKEEKNFLGEILPPILDKKIWESPNSAMKVNIYNLEIFSSSKKDLQLPYREIQDFEKMFKKRFITKPCDLHFHNQSFTCMCKNETKYVNSMDLHLSKLQANLSYKDIILLYETVLIQQEEMAKSYVFDGTNQEVFEPAESFQASQDLSNDSFQSSRIIEKKPAIKPAEEKKESSEGEILSEKTKKFCIEKIELVNFLILFNY